MMRPATTPPTATASRSADSRHRDLQAMLQERQREMQNVLQHRVRHAPACAAGDGLDETEHAEADIQEHLEVTLIHMKADALARVREALVRLEAGEYGFCVECEGEISATRLQAMPFAVRCTACEDSHEQQAARARRFGPAQGFSLDVAGDAGP